jgi:hypothetical protein
VYLSPSEIDSELPIKYGISFNDLTTVIQNSESRKIVAVWIVVIVVQLELARVEEMILNN